MNIIQMDYVVGVQCILKWETDRQNKMQDRQTDRQI